VSARWLCFANGEIVAAAVYDTAVSADLIGVTAWRLPALEL
jgi:hypothetical protein